MPITFEPQWNPVSASRPIVFRTFYTAADPNTVKHAVVRLYLRGDLFKTFFVKPFDSAPSATVGFTEFFFDIDVHEIIQNELGYKTSNFLPTVFPGLGTDGVAINTEFYADLFIEVSYQVLIASTGLLSTEFENEVSSTYTAYAATRQHTESMNLEEFTTLLPTQLGRPLSNRPLSQIICPEDNAFIGIIDQLNFVRFTIFDLNGDPFPSNEYYGFVPSFPDQQTTVGIGPANLYQYTFFGGAALPPIDQIGRYEVDLGVGTLVFPNLSYTKVTDTYTYEITNCCDRRQIRLHWLNPLGAADQYNFIGAKTLELRSESELGEKALVWDTVATNPHNTADFGSFRHSVRGSERFQLETIPLSSEEAVWLQEIAISSLVLIEQDGQYIAANIEDSSQVIDDSTGLIRLNLQINLSNERLIINP